jgi:hypothetical protein
VVSALSARANFGELLDRVAKERRSLISMNDAGAIAGFSYCNWNAQVAVGFLRLPKS